MKNKKSVFSLESDYAPMGDQPTAIAELVKGVNDGKKSQVLLGVTGSGKTLQWPMLLKNYRVQP